MKAPGSSAALKNTPSSPTDWSSTATCAARNASRDEQVENLSQLRHGTARGGNDDYSDVSIDRLVVLIEHHRKEETNAVLSLATRRRDDQARLYRSSGNLLALVNVSQAIFRGPSPLTPAQRELIGAYVSSLNACQYCYGGHRAAAELFGVAPETIDGLIQDLTTAPIESKLRPIFAFVKGGFRAPVQRGIDRRTAYSGQQSKDFINSEIFEYKFIIAPCITHYNKSTPPGHQFVQAQIVKMSTI